MKELIFDLLGPAVAIPMVLAALLVWWQRHAIRKIHVVALILMTAVGFAGFFAVMVAGMANSLPESLVMPLLHVTAWMMVGGGMGFTVSFWLLWSGKFRGPSRGG